MSDIRWPEKYLPGTTDNYVSNEVIVPGLTAADVWPHLNNTAAWPQYYGNATEITVDNTTGTELSSGARFRFTTFGFHVEGEIVEYEPPTPGAAARIAWRAWINGTPEEELDVIHAWLIEDLPGNRVRVLTQESQIGEPAKQLAAARPNPMLNAHQDWLEGLVNFARTHKA